MPKGSAELTASRREEIVNACEMLYRTMSFKDITIKDIGNVTSFTRTSVYNYFQTKEEIFLALMQREYECWAEEMNKLANENETMSADGFASAVARSLESHEQLLKLLAMNHYDHVPKGLQSLKSLTVRHLIQSEPALKSFFLITTVRALFSYSSLSFSGSIRIRWQRKNNLMPYMRQKSNLKCTASMRSFIPA